MNNTAIKIISSFILLCISLSAIPVSLWHQHGTEACALNNQEIENDPCHVRTYHPTDFNKRPCEHKSHIDKEGQSCHFCQIISSHRIKFISPLHPKTFFQSLDEKRTPIEQPVLPVDFTPVIFSRGPPA